MDSTKLAEINALQADKALSSTRHQEVLGHTDNVAQTVLSATSSLIEYLEGHTSKTEVVNQLTSIKTPDVKYVVEALQVLDTTLQKHENTDLSEITGVMRELLDEARKIPKELPESPDKPHDYTTQLTGLKDAIGAVQRVVEAQKLIAEAPIVNVPETTVHVDAPDLSPLKVAMGKVTGAVELTTTAIKEAAAKTTSGLITERFDEYKITYSVPFDDESDEIMVTGINYFFDGKQVAGVKYSYDKKGNLVGGRKV